MPPPAPRGGTPSLSFAASKPALPQDPDAPPSHIRTHAHTLTLSSWSFLTQVTDHLGGLLDQETLRALGRAAALSGKSPATASAASSASVAASASAAGGGGGGYKLVCPIVGGLSEHKQMRQLDRRCDVTLLSLFSAAAGEGLGGGRGGLASRRPLTPTPCALPTFFGP